MHQPWPRSGELRPLLQLHQCRRSSTAVQIASDPRATDPMAGASGAISAVAGAYVYLFPDRRFYLMIFDALLQRIRAIWLLGIWIAFQLVMAVLRVSGVAWWAHIGGFAFGVGAAALYRRWVALRIAALEQASGGVTS